MVMQPLLLNKLFESGNGLGGILAGVFVLLLTIEIIFVFVKYVLTSDK